MTLAEEVTRRLDQNKTLLRSLVESHSSIGPNINSERAAVPVITESPYPWGTLQRDGKRVQAQARKAFRSYLELCEALALGVASDSGREDFAESAAIVNKIIDQAGRTGHMSKETALNMAFTHLDRFWRWVDELPDDREGQTIILPDTNAALYNPDLDMWRFAAHRKFHVLLVTQVIAELDEIKGSEKNESVRNKADGLIRRFKGYRLRNATSSGFVLSANISTFSMEAREPNFATAPEWLDRTHPDDRFLASAFSVATEHPRASVVVVTLDVNLQNKANVAGLEFCEPPEPATPADQSQAAS